MMNAYAAAFDDEPYVEMISPFHETAIGWGGSTPPPDFSEALLDTEYRRLAQALRTAWNNTTVWMPTNWGLSQSNMISYVAYLESIGVGAGNPDVCPSCNMYADAILRGAVGGTDYRGEIPIAFSVEASEMGYDTVGPDGGFTPAEIYDYANHVQHTNHLFWDRHVDPNAGTPEQRWFTGILPFINANPLTHTSLPAVYGGSGPAAPSALNANAVSSSQIDLSWVDNAANETGFEIDRAGNSAFTSGLVTTTAGANATSASSTGLSPATTYYYRVRATNRPAIPPIPTRRAQRPRAAAGALRSRCISSQRPSRPTPIRIPSAARRTTCCSSPRPTAII